MLNPKLIFGILLPLSKFRSGLSVSSENRSIVWTNTTVTTELLLLD